MKVYKFGGASIQNADRIKKVATIIKACKEPLVVVVSALGKTTNELEMIYKDVVFKQGESEKLINKLWLKHELIIDQLFDNDKDDLISDCHEIVMRLKHFILNNSSENGGFIYDQIVCTGELLSTKILQAYLKQQGKKATWINAKEIIHTDNKYQNARIEWEITEQKCKQKLMKLTDDECVVTPGFIGRTPEGFYTTLGREGSDFSASVIAFCLNTKSVTVWKDVPAILNADPTIFTNTNKIKHLTYKEAIEMTYFGAKVIHPKTIKPLENKEIPLYVRSFIDLNEVGTEISSGDLKHPLPPIIIYKQNQILISFSVKDFSFIAEDSLSMLFDAFSRHSIRVNMMQNGAISFSVSADHDQENIDALIEELGSTFYILTNSDLELLTVRHFNQQLIDDLSKNRRILLEERTRSTAQILMTKHATAS